MIVKGYNIGRADCILISDDKEKLMIDCGVTQNQMCISDINNDLRTKNPNSLLISHFHDDHIRGMNYIKGNVFSNIYFSRFGFCFITVQSLEIIVKWLKMIPYTRKTNKTRSYLQNLFSIFKLISNVITPSGRISIINKGDVVNHLGGFNCIHPSIICDSLFDQLILDSLDEFIEKAESLISQEVQNEINNATSRYVSLLADFRGVLNRDTVVKERKNMKKDVLYFEALDMSLINKMDEVLKEIISIGERKVPTKYSNSNLFKKLRDEMNEKSVVIHNDKAMFTGDITDDIVRTLHSSGKFNSKTYGLIKTPHHGSPSHFDATLPLSSIYMSCSNDRRYDIVTTNDYLTNTKMANILHVFTDGSMFFKGNILLNVLPTNIIFEI